jgi:glycosyltransferase involved in cell wall biosynthesis
MKILQIVQKPQRRGAEVFAFQLTQELRSQGHEVGIVYLYPFQGAMALPLHPQDRLLAGQEDHVLEKFPGVHPRLLYRLLQIVAEFQPDVIQVNGARTVKYGAFICRFCRHRSWVLIYRNIGNPQDWVQGWQRYFFYQKLVLPKLDGIVGVSQTTLQNLLNFYHISSSVTYIPTGVSVPVIQIPRAVSISSLVPTISREEIRQKIQTSLEAPVLLSVGSLTSEKRLDRLIRVVSQVRSHLPALQVWLVGDGPLRPALEQQVKAAGLVDVIHFLGVQVDVGLYMNAADLFLLTSDTEGIPGVVLEAGLLGLPAVATRVGGLPECVIEGETGLLMDSHDEAGFAQAILRLLRNSQQRIEMGAKAREWVRANFLMDKIARQYIDFYRQVLNGT